MANLTLKQLFEKCIGDSLDVDTTYDLLTDAKNSIEVDMDLEVTKKEDSSNSTTVGATYITPITLPTDFYMPVSNRSIVVGDKEYYPIPFEQKEAYKDTSYRYFIDHADNKLYLTGLVVTSQTIHIFYHYNTPDIAEGANPVWPAKFHPLVAFDAAETYLGGLDADEVSKTMAPMYRDRAERLRRGIVRWDHKLKLAAMDYSTKRREPIPDSNGFIGNNALWL